MFYNFTFCNGYPSLHFAALYILWSNSLREKNFVTIMECKIEMEVCDVFVSKKDISLINDPNLIMVCIYKEFYTLYY